jgi:hypothetical protein
VLNIWKFTQINDGLASGKYIQQAIEHGPVEIVDLPMKNGDFP